VLVLEDDLTFANRIESGSEQLILNRVFTAAKASDEVSQNKLF
jgi:hypothetical protein